MTYTFSRTRFITETFRVTANTEEGAEDMLSQCDTVACEEGVEQLELTTYESNIELLEQEEEESCPKCGDSDSADCACAVERRRRMEEEENG